MADRDPDTIKQDIDQARDQLAADGGFARRARQSAQDRRRREGADWWASVKKPPVAMSLAGIGALLVVLFVRKIRR